MKRFGFFIMMYLLASFGAGAQGFTIKGTVVDQDGKPVAGAKVSFEGRASVLATTTDEEGLWQMTIEERSSQEVRFKVEADDYPSYVITAPFLNGAMSNINVELFNTLIYKAGEQSTIFLMEAPDPSWGRYYRLDRVDGSKLIFERELTPTGATPYIFFANEDLRIDLRGRAKQGAGRAFSIDNISFTGSLNVWEEVEYTGTMCWLIPDHSISMRQDPFPMYVYPMHAVLYWLRSDYPYFPDEVSLVFHDPEEIIVTGTITDQDDKPVQNAVVTVNNNSASYQAKTDADGRYQIGLEDKDGIYIISAHADGYTSITEGPEIKPSENSVCDLVLYNALNYQAGKRYTIILPVTPDALAGRYFRLDRVEGGNIIFEREYSPQANVPYVFYPNKDFRIDLREMDLSKEAGQTIITVNNEEVGSREAAYFMGSYSYINYSDILDCDTPEYFDDDDNGYTYGRHAYHIDAMHATLLWNWHAFDRPFQPSYQAPSFVFHDAEEDIPLHRHFVEEGKVWKVGTFGTYNPEIGGYTDAHNIEYFYFDGDTIVGGQRCKKMMCREECDINWHSYHEPQASYVGAIYENNQRVYCALPNSDDFVLLYDFATDPNTEIAYYNTVTNQQTSGFIARRTVCEDSLYHGRVTTVNVSLEPYSTQYADLPDVSVYWREGVGYNGFYNSRDLWATGGFVQIMQCTLGDEILYNDPSLKDCVTPQDSEVKKNWLDFTHTVKTRPKGPRRVEAESDEETVTGEYSIKELFVNFKTLTGPYTITVTDAAGQTIYNKVVQTSNVVALNTDISTYPKGSYTITVENEEEMYTAEFKAGDEDGLTPTVQSSMFKVQSTIYNLNGQRLTKPQRGVNIVNGRKVVVR